MAIIRNKLSASTNGRGIIVATGAPTTIHTSTTATSASDEIHVWFVNNTAASVDVDVYMGTTGTGDLIDYNSLPPAAGLQLLVPGLFLASGLICYAAASATGIFAYGFINRLTTGA